MFKYILPILLLSALCAGWVLVQVLARKMKTKNHFDDLNSGACTNCTCGGIQCEEEQNNTL